MLLNIYKPHGNEVVLPISYIDSDDIQEISIETIRHLYTVSAFTKDGKKVNSNLFSKLKDAEEFASIIQGIKNGSRDMADADKFLKSHV